MAQSVLLTKDHVCTFKNTRVDMSMIWHLTIHWQSDLLLLHLCSTLWIVFFGHYGAFNLKFADSGTTLNLLFSLLHVIKHKHYINGSAMCQ